MREVHVTNGDIVAERLSAADPARTVVAWRDVLHEGPVPDVPAAELRRVRAAFLDAAEADLAAPGVALDEHRDGAYVLWFEADLFDQLQLIQILARLHALAVAPERITLICIGEHLGIARFGGLGELTTGQLEPLPAHAAAPLTGAALEYATRAWAALRAPHPTELATIAVTPSSELRFVAEAFDRLAREYPSTRDGLSLTERRLLAAVAAGAPTAGDAFLRAAAREARPFLGDTWAFDRVARLAAAATPLLAASPPVDRHTRIALTDAGRRVLDGRADHVALNGVDRWIGGVQLVGRHVPWRWDEGTEAIVGERQRRH